MNAKTDKKDADKDERPSPMADDKTLKASGHVAERRRAVPTVRMHKDKTEMDVSTLDVEAHSRMGWKLSTGS